MNEHDDTSRPHTVRPSTQSPDLVPMRALWLLVGSLIAIEALFQLADAGLWGLSRGWAYTHGAFWRALLVDDVIPAFEMQRYTMFITHAFLHGGVVHVAMNAVIILSIGKLVVSLSSQARMLLLFVLGAIGGGAVYALFGADGLIPMVGASGAGFAFIAAWKRWEWTALRATGRSTRPVMQFVGGLAALNVVLHFGLGGTLAWQAHLGGAVVGWIVAPWLSRRPTL